MNRQERRKKLREIEVTRRALKQIAERQSQIDDIYIESWSVATALAVCDACGDDTERIEKVMVSLHKRLASMHEYSLAEMIQELQDKTGIEFVW